jgi:hypothetical protein
MLPKFRSFVRPIIRLFVRSFIVPIHRSSFVHRLSIRLFNITVHHYYSAYYSSSVLFIIVTVHRYYSSTLFSVVIHRTVHRHYSSVLLFIAVTIHRWYIIAFSSSLFTVLCIINIYCYYSLLLFIDHPITPNFNYSSIMLSSPPKTSQTHIPVIRTLVTVIFLPIGNFPSGHPSQVSPSWARLTLRFLWTRLPNSDFNNSRF